MEDFIKEQFGLLMSVTVLALWKRLFPEKNKPNETQNQHEELTRLVKENTFHLKEIREDVGDIKTDITILKTKQDK